MLEYVRKRNGTIEKADASKINLWVTNLSKDLKDRLEWSKVLMEVVKESPSEMSSQDLQLAISKKFVAQKDWPGVLMGGRFYAIWHWKNMFGDSIPTVKEHHKQMVALGLMEDMGYTDEDYEQIEQFIDHNRDLSMASTGHPGQRRAPGLTGLEGLDDLRTRAVRRQSQPGRGLGGKGAIVAQRLPQPAHAVLLLGRAEEYRHQQILRQIAGE